jgi:hypothetical protein
MEENGEDYPREDFPCPFSAINGALLFWIRDLHTRSQEHFFETGFAVRFFGLRGGRFGFHPALKRRAFLAPNG